MPSPRSAPSGRSGRKLRSQLPGIAGQLSRRVARRGGVWGVVGAIVVVVAIAWLGVVWDDSSSVPPNSPPSASDVAASQRAVVERIVDGDTLIADVAGERTRIRLLNIDTPETSPGSGPECLGLEATAALRELVPPGAPIRLEFDRERTDRYDRMLAGVYTEDGRFVNAEIARRGLAHVVVFGTNTRFVDEVRAAEAEAQQHRRGLHEPGACR